MMEESGARFSCIRGTNSDFLIRKPINGIPVII